MPTARGLECRDCGIPVSPFQGHLFFC
jgi:hypothetical protein